MRKGWVSVALAAGMVVGAFVSAHASVIQVFNRSSLPTTFDWNSFGPAGTVISTPESRPGGPGTVTVASSVGTMLIHQEGVDWHGNFAVGDSLLALADGDRSDSFIVSFSGAPVFGLGTQIQPASGFFGSFTGIMELFSASNTLLGEVTIAGNSTNAEDNSAPFLGAMSTTPIDHADFLVAVGFPGFPTEGDLAINQLSLLAAVPEPATALVLGTAILGLAATRRQRSSK